MATVGRNRSHERRTRRRRCAPAAEDAVLLQGLAVLEQQENSACSAPARTPSACSPFV